MRGVACLIRTTCNHSWSFTGLLTPLLCTFLLSGVWLSSRNICKPIHPTCTFLIHSCHLEDARIPQHKSRPMFTISSFIYWSRCCCTYIYSPPRIHLYVILFLSHNFTCRRFRHFVLALSFDVVCIDPILRRSCWACYLFSAVTIILSPIFITHHTSAIEVFLIMYKFRPSPIICSPSSCAGPSDPLHQPITAIS
jgi:hypothetical protein